MEEKKVEYKVSDLGLTSDEQNAMDKLMEAFEAFKVLPMQHPDELRDYVDGIRRCQDVLAVRICRRAYPKGWATYNCELVIRKE